MAATIHWLRAPFANLTQQPQHLMLNLGIPDSIFLEAYKFTDGRLTPLLILPHHAPFSARPEAERTLALPMELKAGEQGEVILRYGIHVNTPLPLKLVTFDRFHREISSDNLMNGMLVGLLAALALMSLLDFIASRQVVRLIYIALLAAMGLFMAQFEGYNFVYLWPDHGEWNQQAPVVIGACMQILHVLFTMTIFRLQHRRRIFWMLNGYILILLAGAITYLLAGPPEAGFAAILLYAPLSLGIGFYFLRKGDPAAGYYLLAAVSYVICNNILNLLSIYGFAPGLPPFLFPRIGYGCEAVLFVLSLAQQTRALRRQIENGLRQRLEEARQLAATEAEKNKALLAAQEQQMQLAAAGHDMAQPLTAIRYAVAAMRLQGGSNDGVTRHIDQALNYTETLLRSLMDESKRKHAEGRGEVDLGRLLKDLAEAHRPTAAAKGLQLRLCPSRQQIVALEETLIRILNNLLGNAIRYTQKGKILLGVRLRPDGVEIQIADTGPGFDSKRRRELLSPFVQSGELSAEKSGHGLGLHIVRTLCEQAGYRLTIRAIPGQGSLFGIHIPQDMN